MEYLVQLAMQDKVVFFLFIVCPCIVILGNIIGFFIRSTKRK